MERAYSIWYFSHTCPPCFNMPKSTTLVENPLSRIKCVQYIDMWHVTHILYMRHFKKAHHLIRKWKELMINSESFEVRMISIWKKTRGINLLCADERKKGGLLSRRVTDWPFFLFSFLLFFLHTSPTLLQPPPLALNPQTDLTGQKRLWKNA